MHIVKLAITISRIIASIAAAELDTSPCQHESNEQRMRRGDTHHFYRGPLRDHVLRGRGYRNDTTRSYLTCAGTCLLEDACKSFNFCPDDKRCELNSAVYSKNMSDLQFSSGCLYFDEEYRKEYSTTEPTTTTTTVVTTTSPLTTTPAECLSPEPLGLEDGTIPDDRITASSVYDDDFPSSKARVNSTSSWAPGQNVNSWLQVDLVTMTTVSGVITQGGSIGWVKQCKVAFKTESSSDYEHVTDTNGDIQIFDGNSDANTPVTNRFRQSIVATVVRIEPVAWDGYPTMRLELLGCRLN